MCICTKRRAPCIFPRTRHCFRELRREELKADIRSFRFCPPQAKKSKRQFSRVFSPDLRALFALFTARKIAMAVGSCARKDRLFLWTAAGPQEIRNLRVKIRRLSTLKSKLDFGGCRLLGLWPGVTRFLT